MSSYLLRQKKRVVWNFDSIKTNSRHTPGYDQSRDIFFCRNPLDVGSGVVRLISAQYAIVALHSFETHLKKRYPELRYGQQYA